MRQFISSLPDELLEAARIDGLGEFGIFRRIVLPVVRPAFASLGIIFFMGSWNNFLWPLILLKSPEMYTLSVSIYSITGGIQVPYHLIMAGSSISVLPLLIIFLIFQRQFIAGITAGAVKG
jgi:ABC-type glycerol-3-phosphate transport system permease component